MGFNGVYDGVHLSQVFHWNEWEFSVQYGNIVHVAFTICKEREVD